MAGFGPRLFAFVLLKPRGSVPNDYLAPGFPGQSRVIADLYYNRYRDYDPTTGRYIQADPIGLAGGANNYAYAENNPIGLIDPLGLKGFHPDGNGCFYDDDGNLLFCDKPLEPVYWEEWLLVGKAWRICDALYKTWRWERRLRQVRDRRPGWKESPNRNGDGRRFENPANKGDRLRVDRGNPDSPWPSQRPDHVIEQKGGKTVDVNGNPINAPKPTKTPDAHVPLKDWLKNN